MSIVETIGQGLRAAAEYFGWARERAVRNNSPEMQGAAKSGDDTKTVDEARKVIEKGDETSIREKLS